MKTLGICISIVFLTALILVLSIFVKEEEIDYYSIYE